MREEIFKHIITAQEELINNLIKNLETYESTTDLDEQDTIDLDDQSHQADLQEVKIRINQKLEEEREDLKNIKKMRIGDFSTFEEGAIVETEDLFFLIGYTFAPIQYDKKKILGISTSAPAFAANLGKKKGEDLKLNEVTKKIKNIY